MSRIEFMSCLFAPVAALTVVAMAKLGFSLMASITTLILLTVVTTVVLVATASRKGPNS